MVNPASLTPPPSALATLERAEVFLRTKTLEDPKGLYTIISTTYSKAMADLEITMRQLEAALATDEETVMPHLIECSDTHQRVQLAYRRVCNLINTVAPEFTIPEEERAAKERKAFAIAISSDLYRYLEKNGIDITRAEFREIRGDGNCFYYSTATYLIDGGFVDYVSDICKTISLSPAHKEALERFLDIAKKHPETAIADTHGMKVFVRALRELTAAHIANNIKDYEDTFSTSLHMEFPDDVEVLAQRADESPAKYLKRMIDTYVREMGRDASVSCITALARALKLPVAIHDPHHQPKPLGINTDAETALPLLNVVKSGEHYYLLYLASTPRAAKAEPVRVERAYLRLQVYYTGTERLFIRGASGFVRSPDDAPCAGAGRMAASKAEETELSWARGVALRPAPGRHLREIEITPGSEYKICLDDSVFCEGPNLAASEADLSAIFPIFGEASSILVKGDAGDGNHFAVCGEGRVRIGEKIFDLSSWDPKQAVALTRLDPRTWGIQIEVLSPVAFKVVKVKPDKSVVWEKGENRALSALSALSITPEF